MSVKIVNRALRRIYAAPIAALDGSTEIKKIIADELEEAVEHALRRSAYGEVSALFCPQEAAIVDVACDLPVGYCFAFHLPADYLRAKRVDPVVGKDCADLPEIQWRIMSVRGCRSLVTNCKPVKMEYVARPSDLDGLPPDLRNVIKLRLAMALVDPLNADKSLKADIAAELKEAEASASEVSEGQDQTDEYLSAPGEILEARACAWGGRRG